MRIGVVGSGRAGSAIARGLRSRRGRGVRLALILSRRPAAAAARLGLPRRRVTSDPSRFLAACDVVILCVPDDAILPTAASLAREPLLARRVVLHTSGASGAGVLGAAARAGARVGALHPLAALPGPSTGRAVPAGIAWAIGGEPAASATARRVARALGGVPVELPATLRGRYHLAATLAANGSTVLAALALSLLPRRPQRLGRELRAGFAALLVSAAARIAEEGPEAGLTGPASRGDLGTLGRHLAILRTRPAGVRAIYALLASEAVRIARGRHTLSPGRADATLRLLSAPCPGRSTSRSARRRSSD